MLRFLLDLLFFILIIIIKSSSTWGKKNIVHKLLLQPHKHLRHEKKYLREATNCWQPA